MNSSWIITRRDFLKASAAVGASAIPIAASACARTPERGLQMIFSSDTQPTTKEPEHDMAVFPLAIPATATPGAILAVILLTDNHIHPIAVQIGTAVIMLGVLAVTLMLLLLSDRIIKIIGIGGASILTRVMGMILAALSVEFVMNTLGIGQWIQPAP